jgi:hypothetical protein
MQRWHSGALARGRGGRRREQDGQHDETLWLQGRRCGGSNVASGSNNLWNGAMSRMRRVMDRVARWPMWPTEIILLPLVATVANGSENYFRRLDVAHESYNFHRLSLKPIEVILTNKYDVHVCNPRMCAGTDVPTFWAGQPSHGGTRNASGAEPSRTIDLMTAPCKQSVRHKPGMQILYCNYTPSTCGTKVCMLAAGRW